MLTVTVIFQHTDYLSDIIKLIRSHDKSIAVHGDCGDITSNDNQPTNEILSHDRQTVMQPCVCICVLSNTPTPPHTPTCIAELVAPAGPVRREDEGV